jgi:hypothetical protein
MKMKVELSLTVLGSNYKNTLCKTPEEHNDTFHQYERKTFSGLKISEYTEILNIVEKQYTFSGAATWRTSCRILLYRL